MLSVMFRITLSMVVGYWSCLLGSQRGDFARSWVSFEALAS